MDVEEAAGELADRVDRVVPLRRPPTGVDCRSERALVADRSEHLARGALGMVLKSEAHPVRFEHRGCTGAIGVDDPAEAGDQVDVERVREAAGSLHVADGVSYAPGKGDYADPVTRERVTGDLDVVGRRPAPVEVREPEVDRVEADVR